MEWSKDKTMKFIELLQMNPHLWNTSLCDTRREKQKRKEQLRNISEALGVSVADTTKKLQHLRTQYNREYSKEAVAFSEDPNDTFVSNWYAYEYLHFIKDSNKPYKLLQSDSSRDINGTSNGEANSECKPSSLTPPHKVARTDFTLTPEIIYSPPPRDEFSVFGEYVANELRSLKGEKDLLLAKKKIQDVIFDVKMGNIARTEHIVVNHNQPTSIHNANVANVRIEPLTSSNTSSATSISEIMINSACHYSNFKVDPQ